MGNEKLGLGLQTKLGSEVFMYRYHDPHDLFRYACTNKRDRTLSIELDIPSHYIACNGINLKNKFPVEHNAIQQCLDLEKWYELPKNIAEDVQQTTFEMNLTSKVLILPIIPQRGPIQIAYTQYRKAGAQFKHKAANAEYGLARAQYFPQEVSSALRMLAGNGKKISPQAYPAIHNMVIAGKKRTSKTKK